TDSQRSTAKDAAARRQRAMGTRWAEAVRRSGRAQVRGMMRTKTGSTSGKSLGKAKAPRSEVATAAKKPVKARIARTARAAGQLGRGLTIDGPKHMIGALRANKIGFAVGWAAV